MEASAVSTCRWVIVRSCLLLSVLAAVDSLASEGDSRQTYVVRYKGEGQTIPVTVVLDYKKQTEYVINMTPRTPSKSVTFYDFKERIIAYKDLTNRECFLDRLSHETLQEEHTVLKKLKNPVNNDSPVILTLEPGRPSLTPTEVRNIAGQKSAMFCRGMSTWLLIHRKATRRTRRQASHVVQRTYGHYGHQSNNYAHYGHETYSITYAPNRIQSHRAERHQISPRTRSRDESNHLAANYPDSTLRGVNNASAATHHHHRLHPTPSQDPFNFTDNNPAPSLPVARNIQSPPTAPHAQFWLPGQLQTAPLPTDGHWSPGTPRHNHHLPSSGALNSDDEDNIKPGRSYPVYSESNSDALVSGVHYQHNRLEPVPNKGSHPQIIPQSVSNNQHLKTDDRQESDEDVPHPHHPSPEDHQNGGPNNNPPHHHPSLALLFPLGPLSSGTQKPFSVNTRLGYEVVSPLGLHAHYNTEYRTGSDGTHNRSEPHSPSFPPNGRGPPSSLPHPEQHYHTGNPGTHDLHPESAQSHPHRNNYHSAPSNLNHLPHPLFPSPKWHSEISKVINIPLNGHHSPGLEKEDYDDDENGEMTSTETSSPEDPALIGKPQKSPYTPLPTEAPNFEGRLDYEDPDTPSSIPHLPSLPKNYREIPIQEPFRPSPPHDPNATKVIVHSPHHNRQKMHSLLNGNHPKHKQKSSNNKLRLLKPTPVVSSSVPNITVDEGIPRRQERLSNVLQLFTPDEIVIDIEKYPTGEDFYHSAEALHSAFDLHHNATSRKPSPRTEIKRTGTRTRTSSHLRQEQLSGQKWRSSYAAPNFPSPPFDPIRRHDEGSASNDHQLLLPPGVSVHPRHPQAPYAELASASAKRTMLNSLHSNADRIRHGRSHPKRHHRHHRKRNGSCCQQQDIASSTSNGESPPCCSSSSRRGTSGVLSCCSGRRRGQRPSPATCCPPPSPAIRRHHRRPHPSPETSLSDVTGRHGDAGPRDPENGRCQQDTKMCRTLYQSARRVLVCRTALVDGC